MKKQKNIGEIPARLLGMVAEDYNISMTAIIGSKRNFELVDARSVVALVLFSMGYPKKTIGRLLSDRHHTTIINLIERARERKDLQKYVKKYYKLLK